jgi:hypothetical protein
MMKKERDGAKVMILRPIQCIFRVVVVLNMVFPIWYLYVVVPNMVFPIWYLYVVVPNRVGIGRVGRQILLLKK